MQKKTTLVVLAAGMGSRFGGLKQMAPFGPNGETIIDYSVYDAKEAGFDRSVIIIKKSIEKDFRELVGKRLEKMMDIDYAFQEFDALPAGYSIPEGRTKPYGTGHAILCTKDLVATLGDADDVVRILIQTEKGITLDIDINQAAAIQKPEWMVYGQYGAVSSGRTSQGQPGLLLKWYDPAQMPKLKASEDLAAKNRKYSNDVPIPWATEEIPIDPAAAVDFYGKAYEYYAEEKAPYVPIEETLYVMDLIRRCHADAQ